MSKKDVICFDVIKTSLI